MALPYNVMAGVVTKVTTQYLAQATRLSTLQVLCLGLQIPGPESKGTWNQLGYFD